MRSFTLLCTLAMAISTMGFSPSINSLGRPRFASRLFMSDEMKTGTVKWFNTVKGFGFIVPDDDSGDIFVHQTAILAEGFRSLADGESVEFTVETDENGRTKAVKVTGPGGSYVQGAPYQRNDDYSY